MLNRRQFLKGAALATTAAGAAGVAGVAVTGGSLAGRGDKRGVAVGGRLYLVDGRARVLVSQDQGASWKLHSKFAPQHVAERMRVDSRGRAWLTVRHESRTFSLRLSDDGLAWRTA